VGAGRGVTAFLFASKAVLVGVASTNHLLDLPLLVLSCNCPEGGGGTTFPLNPKPFALETILKVVASFYDPDSCFATCLVITLSFWNQRFRGE